MNAVELESIMVGFATKVDGSISLRFTTQREMSPEDIKQISQYRSTTGYLLFKADSWQDSEVPKGNTSGENKSPSERLRNCLYKYWETKKSEYKFESDFDAFYKRKMESIITSVKIKFEEY
jgi:hypothetical protein